MLLDKVKFTGSLSIKLFDENQNLKEERHINNLVVDSGFAYIASRILGNSPGVMSHMALGTGTTAAAGAQTTLTTEIGRVAFNSASNVTVNVTNDSAQYVATFDAGVATGALAEAGLFNASSGGTMLARTTFPVVNKQATDTLVITWIVRAGQST